LLDNSADALVDMDSNIKLLEKTLQTKKRRRSLSPPRRRSLTPTRRRRSLSPRRRSLTPPRRRSLSPKSFRDKRKPNINGRVRVRSASLNSMRRRKRIPPKPLNRNHRDQARKRKSPEPRGRPSKRPKFEVTGGRPRSKRFAITSSEGRSNKVFEVTSSTEKNFKHSNRSSKNDFRPRKPRPGLDRRRTRTRTSRRSPPPKRRKPSEVKTERTEGPRVLERPPKSSRKESPPSPLQLKTEPTENVESERPKSEENDIDFDLAADVLLNNSELEDGEIVSPKKSKLKSIDERNKVSYDKDGNKWREIESTTTKLDGEEDAMANKINTYPPNSPPSSPKIHTYPPTPPKKAPLGIIAELKPKPPPALADNLNGIFQKRRVPKKHDHTNKEPDKRGWIDFKESPKLLCLMQNHAAININEPSKDLRVGCRAMMETKVVRLDKQMFEIYDEKNNAKMIVDAKLLTPMNKSQLKAKKSAIPAQTNYRRRDRPESRGKFKLKSGRDTKERRGRGYRR